MAVESAGSAGHAGSRYGRLRRVVHALFPEARRLQRRRRLRLAALALVAAAAAVAFVRGGRDLGRGQPPAGGATFAVSSVTLPAAGEFSAIAVIGGRLIVSGGPAGSLPVSGYWNSLVNGRAPGTCDAATVDPRTLALGHVMRANCGNPALYGERVLPISYGLRGGPPTGVTIAVRIARVDPSARDGYQLGPVVTSASECSDCQMGWTYGAGSLWLYNPNPFGSNAPRRSGVLLRISTRTGAVLERWATPTILRALLAADVHSLWLSPSIESGSPAGPRSKLLPYISLYRITPGRRSPQRVFTVGRSGARWLVASGHTASAAIDNGRGGSVVWTFSNTAQPVRGQPLDVRSFDAELGTGGATVVGNPTTGFYSVLVGSGTERVVHAAPAGRDQRLVATILAPGVKNYDGTAAGAVLDGVFYFLDPTVTTGRVRLHRVTPR